MRSSLSMQICVGIVALSAGLMMLGPGVFSETTPISLSGQVTVNGKPLSFGTIRFFSEGLPSPACDVSLIGDGEYVISNSETLVPAKYEVQISGLGAQASFETVDPLPSRFNRRSVLRVEIKKRGSYRFNFDLKD